MIVYTASVYQINLTSSKGGGGNSTRHFYNRIYQKKPLLEYTLKTVVNSKFWLYFLLYIWIVYYKCKSSISDKAIENPNRKNSFT